MLKSLKLPMCAVLPHLKAKPMCHLDTCCSASVDKAIYWHWKLRMTLEDDDQGGRSLYVVLPLLWSWMFLCFSLERSTHPYYKQRNNQNHPEGKCVYLDLTPWPTFSNVTLNSTKRKTVKLYKSVVLLSNKGCLFMQSFFISTGKSIPVWQHPEAQCYPGESLQYSCQRYC